MAEAIPTIFNTLTNTPLPVLIEKLGLAVANAQAALDRNSINMLQELTKTPVRINGNDYNLLTMGFVPTFYAFTEATIEAKMEFSMTEETSFSANFEASVNTKVVAVSVGASYARKFGQSAEGSSSMAARLVSLPPPEQFLAIIRANAKEAEVPVTKITITGGDTVNVNDNLQFNISVEPANATNKEVNWSVSNSSATITKNGLLITITTGNVTVTASAKNNSEIKDTKIVKIN